MDAYYSFPGSVDASSPVSISPPASVCASTSDFIYSHDVPSPDFQGELDLLHPQSLGTQYVQAPENTSTPHPNMDIQSASHRHTPPNSASHRSSSPTEFDFMHSLLSIRGTRDQSGSGGDQGGEAAGGPTESEAAVAETIVRARKSWKTVKGRSEPVWPPYLEKALVQALLQYKPHDSRYARALGRFPKRNRYISDYIYETTGVRRTPKQVGSRLQQLKDVSCGKMLLNHVASWALQPSPKHPSGNDSGVSPSSLHPDLDVLISNMHGNGSDSPSPVSPPASGSSSAHEATFSTVSAMKSHGPHSTLCPTPHGALISSAFDSPPITPVARRMDVFVPFDPNYITGNTSGEENGEKRGSPLLRFGGCLARPETVIAPQPVDSERTSGWLEPRVTFASRDPIAARSFARVWVDNSMFTMPSSSHDAVQERVKSERPGMVQAHQYGEPLVCMQTPASRASAAQTSFYSTDSVALKDCDEEDRDCFIYATHLVDESIWHAMRREGPGLRRYTITQEIMHSLDSPTTRRGEVFLIVTYRFVPISRSVCPPSNAMLPLDSPDQGYVLNYKRGSVSPASSETSSPVNISPSTHGHPPILHGSMAGRDQSYRMMRNAQPYVHHQSQMRVPPFSIQPSIPTVPHAATLLSSFNQDGSYNTSMSSGASPAFDTDFSCIDMGSLHLSTNSPSNTEFDHSQPFC